MENLFLVKFNKCEQVSPDDWELIWHEKLFTENSTIKDIQDWVKSRHNAQWNREHSFTEIRLSMPDTDAPKNS